MGSSVTNFKFDRKRRHTKTVEEDSEESSSLPSRLRRSISKVMEPSDLIQYTFDLRFPIKVQEEKYEELLSRVCKRWKRKFKFEPIFALVSISHVAFTYALTIFVDDPQLLIEHRSDFIEDIARTVH